MPTTQAEVKRERGELGPGLVQQEVHADSPDDRADHPDRDGQGDLRVVGPAAQHAGEHAEDHAGDEERDHRHAT